MARILFIIAPLRFRDEEYFDTREELEADNEIITASITKEPATSMMKAEVIPDIAIEDALEQANTFDAIIFVGGQGSEYYFHHPIAHELAQYARDHDKVLASICWAGIILANAGVLEGKRATVWVGPERKEIRTFQEKGVTYVSEHVVTDGKIITADGPKASREFAKAIRKALGQA